MKRGDVIKAIAEAGASFEDAEELQKFLPAFYAFEKIVSDRMRERCAKPADKPKKVKASIRSIPNYQFWGVTE